MITPLISKEGWHVMHLFYSIEHTLWQTFTEREQKEAKRQFCQLIDSLRKEKDTQVLVYAIATLKADLGVMILTPDLHVANAYEKRITLGLGAGVLQASYSYFSQTERSEYMISAEKYAEETLIGEQKLTPDTPEYNKGLEEFKHRMEHYLQHRMYPKMPSWPVICFYPMSKRRLEQDNWYSLDFEARRQLMAGHARVGKTYAGRVLQLITGSTGLDEMEWGVTLLAKDTADIKAIVYEMRFDEVSAKYAEFGDFYIGMIMETQEVLERLCL